MAKKFGSEGALYVAAGEACVRLRSSRKIMQRCVSGRPRTQFSRLLRSRTQASLAATKKRVLVGGIEIVDLDAIT